MSQDKWHVSSLILTMVHCKNFTRPKHLNVYSENVWLSGRNSIVNSYNGCLWEFFSRASDWTKKFSKTTIQLRPFPAGCNSSEVPIEMSNTSNNSPITQMHFFENLSFLLCSNTVKCVIHFSFFIVTTIFKIHVSKFLLKISCWINSDHLRDQWKQWHGQRGDYLRHLQTLLTAQFQQQAIKKRCKHDFIRCLLHFCKSHYLFVCCDWFYRRGILRYSNYQTKHF